MFGRMKNFTADDLEKMENAITAERIRRGGLIREAVTNVLAEALNHSAHAPSCSWMLAGGPCDCWRVRAAAIIDS